MRKSHSLLDMGIADVSPQIANARLGAILTRQAVIDAATRQYLAGQSLDMSALAAELGIGRSTLYRIVGNRENLLGTLLAQATERTFRRATTYTTAEGGLEHVLEVLDRFMHAIIAAQPPDAVRTRALAVRAARLIAGRSRADRGTTDR